MKNNKLKTAIIITAGAVLTTGIVVGVIEGVTSGMATFDNVIKVKEWTTDMNLELDSVEEFISKNIMLNATTMEPTEEISETEESVQEETTKETITQNEETIIEKEEPTTQNEEPTTQKIDYAQVDWWAILNQVCTVENESKLDWESIYNILLYTDKPSESEVDTLLAEVKKADNYEDIDWNATVDYSFGVDVVVTHREEPTTKAPVRLTLEDKLEMDKASYEDGYYTDEKGTKTYIVRQRDDEVMQAKNEWIKANFGTSFTHNGIEFKWDEKEKLFYRIEQYGSIHYMTSTTTSIEGKYLRKSFSYRIADYLGFYGLDFALHNNEVAFADEIFIWEDREMGMNVSEPYSNNIGYLKELGWIEVTEEGDVSKDWDLESPEGVPAKLMSNGDIAIYVKRADAERETLEYFTIEEYNKFISNNNWVVSSRSGARGFEFEPQENWQKYVRKYVKIQ